MRIRQLSTALPSANFSTEELIQDFPCTLSDTLKQNIFNLGVSRRFLVDHLDKKARKEHFMNEDELVDLCCKACDDAAQKVSLSKREINCLISAYDANPFLSPGLSQLLVRQLDLDPYVHQTNVQGSASTAFLKTLELADNYLAAHPEDNVMLCISGVSSYWFQNQVRGFQNVMDTSKIAMIKENGKKEFELRKWIAMIEFFLFGDGVAAAIVTKDKGGLISKATAEITNVDQRDHLAGYSKLTALDEPFRFGFHSYLGKEIPILGAKYTSLALRRLLKQDSARITKRTKKWVVHTGSQKILNELAKQNHIATEALKESHYVLRNYGNLAGASLPFILHRVISSGSLSTGDLILMIGYGWGFSASASLLEFDKQYS